LEPHSLAVSVSRHPSVRSVALASALGAATWPVDMLPARPAVFAVIDTLVSTPALWTNHRVSVELLDIAGVPAELVRARTVSAPGRTVLHLHGGGFVFGGPGSHRALAESLSVTCRAEVLLPGFRQPPRASVTEMVADCLAVYRWLVAR
jgi:acetyl esterase/lipase